MAIENYYYHQYHGSKYNRTVLKETVLGAEIESETASGADHNSSQGLDDIILNIIIKNPGIRYRELLLLTGLCNGVLSYHINKIEKSKKVIVMRENRRVTRYFSVYASAEEILLIRWFRNCNTRQIILKSLLKHNNGCSFRELVHYTNKSPSTVFWHLKRLKEAKIISSRKDTPRYFVYYLLYGTVFTTDIYQNLHICCVKTENKRK
jgi:DNA-binding transcriptional ArsR family regulator